MSQPFIGSLSDIYSATTIATLASDRNVSQMIQNPRNIAHLQQEMYVIDREIQHAVEYRSVSAIIYQQLKLICMKTWYTRPRGIAISESKLVRG